jgi:membrane-associated phospholipid phosphatase
MIVMKSKWRVIVSLLVIFGACLLMEIAFCAGNDSVEVPNIFVHKDTQILADQTIGRLLVSSGNVVVDGRVTEGILVVDGNVTIASEGRVDGKVVVLGGEVTIEQGAEVKKKPWVIAPQGHPLIPMVVGVFLLAGAVSLILLPVLFWLMGHLFKKTPWYPRVKKEFLAIQRRWPGLYIGASLGISALMLTIFTTLAWKTIFRHAMGVFDNTFIWLVRYFASPGLDKIMLFVTKIGFGVSYMVIVSISFLMLVHYRRWREIGILAICSLGGGALNFWLKYLFHRSRPDLLHIIKETGYSFPSGHAMASMCFYGMGAFLIMRTIPSWRGRLTVVTLAGMLIVAIGISRIYLGAHYPSDVVAGFAAGSMWVGFCISLLMWWERERVKE